MENKKQFILSIVLVIIMITSLVIIVKRSNNTVEEVKEENNVVSNKTEDQLVMDAFNKYLQEYIMNRDINFFEITLYPSEEYCDKYITNKNKQIERKATILYKTDKKDFSLLNYKKKLKDGKYEVTSTFVFEKQDDGTYKIINNFDKC